jgi:hypothetical protein
MRQADGLAKLHHGLVEVSRLLARKKSGEFSLDGTAELGLMEIPPQAAQARDHPGHVTVQHGVGLIESDA